MSLGNPSTVTVDRDGHVLLMGLNRPGKRNAFTQEMLDELSAAYGLLEFDEELRCGVLYANGDHFTGGLDLADVGPALTAGRSPFPDGGRDPWRLGRHLVEAGRGSGAGSTPSVVRRCASPVRRAGATRCAGCSPARSSTPQRRTVSAWCKRSPPTVTPRWLGRPRSRRRSPSVPLRWGCAPRSTPLIGPVSTATTPRSLACCPTLAACDRANAGGGWPPPRG